MQTLKLTKSKGAKTKFLIPVQKAIPPHQPFRLININHVVKIEANAGALTFTMVNGDVLTANESNDLWHSLIPFIAGIETGKK